MLTSQCRLINDAAECNLPDITYDANSVYLKNPYGTMEPVANSGMVV
jgi:hypothetical protein